MGFLTGWEFKLGEMNHKKIEMNLEFHFWFSFASESSVRCVNCIFWFIVWSSVSPCGQSVVDVVAFLLHCAVCCLIYASLKGLYDCLSSTSPRPPLHYLFPFEVLEILFGRKALLEIAYFINCLVTQRGWLLFSCLIYFENFATELTLINELSVASNKLCVGYIDWEGF